MNSKKLKCFELPSLAFIVIIFVWQIIIFLILVEFYVNSGSNWY